MAEEIKERIKLHLFKIQILEISTIITVIPARKVFKDRGQLRGKIFSTINGIESNSIKSAMMMDLFMHMERGKDGRWAIVWSEVNEVGPKVVQPLKPTVHNVIISNPLNTAKPKSVWRTRQSHTLETQPTVSV